MLFIRACLASSALFTGDCRKLQADLRAGVAKLAASLRDKMGTIERKRLAVNDSDSEILAGKLVARDGIEPPTLRFSVACSTN